jgi:hypothetical protein
MVIGRGRVWAIFGLSCLLLAIGLANPPRYMDIGAPYHLYLLLLVVLSSTSIVLLRNERWVMKLPAVATVISSLYLGVTTPSCEHFNYCFT